MSKKQTKQASSPRRWDELSKQPEAKWIKIYDQNDKYDTKGTTLLVSPRVVKDFDHFVDHVNDKLKPGLGARRIYTSMGGTEVKSLDELQPNKEYTAARRRFKKRKPLSPRKNSKKGSAGSSEGYHSSEDLKTKNANGRQTLMERQALFAKKRSESEPPVSNRNKVKDDSPLFKKSPRKPKFLDVTPHTGGKKKKEIKASPAKKVATAIKATKTNPTSNKTPIKFAGAREKTPPGKKRMAFRGQYIFVSDDDDYDYDEDKDNRAGDKKGSDDDEYDDYDTDSKKPAAFASRKKSNASLKSTITNKSFASARSKASSSLSTKSKKDKSDEEYSDNSDDDAKSNKSAISKISKQSTNHLTASRSPSKLSSRSAGSTKSKTSVGSIKSKVSARSIKSKASAGSTKSKVSAASRSSSRKPSDAGYNSDKSNKSAALNKTFNNSKKSSLSNSDDSDNDSDDSKKTSKNSDSDSDSKKSARSRLTTRKSIGGAKSRNNSNSDDSDGKKSTKSRLTTRNSNKSRNNSDSDDSDGGKSTKSRLTTKKSIAGSARSKKDSDSDQDSDSGKSTKSKLSVNRSTKSGKSKKDSDSDDGRAASRISKYSKFSKLSSKESKKKDSGSDSEEYSEYDSDNSDYEKSR